MLNNFKRKIILLIVLGLFCSIFFIQFDTKEFSSTTKNYLCTSTLPYGTSIIFNSLEKIFGKNNLKTFRCELSNFPEKKIAKSTIFIIGLESSYSEGTINQAYKLAEQGANVIISFAYPAKNENIFTIFSEPEKSEMKRKQAETENKNEKISQKTLFNFALTPFANNGNYSKDLNEIFNSNAQATKFLPTNFTGYIKFSTKLYFSQVKNFIPLYTIKNKPIVIEKSFNNSNGRLIAMSSSFIFTNEALKLENNNEKFLSYLLKNRNHIYFYERHLGLRRNLTIVWLLKQYRLKIALSCLIIFIALFI